VAIKAAFASSDGANVDRHFGRADRFVIYTLTGEGSSFEETRELKTVSIEDQDFNLKSIAEMLSDCVIIVAQKFGRHSFPLFDPARSELLELDGPINGMLPYLEKLLRIRKKYRSS
jgi:predicted Fe-Mo cluster-binding NifX family protein